MANTREIRKRIKSVRNTAQITRAMQLVAASKMKRAQERALGGRPFAIRLAEVIARFESQVSLGSQHPFFKAREVKRRGVLILSSDRGLSGSLNSNLSRSRFRIQRRTARSGRSLRPSKRRTGTVRSTPSRSSTRGL